MSVTDGYPVVYYVKPDGSDGADGLSWANAKQTLNGAKSAAAAGSLIIVGPGTYNERPIGKTGVDWHFCQGANVQYTGSANGGMWDDSSAGTNGAIVTRITGHARLIHATTGSGDVPVFRISNGSSRFYVECDRIQSSSSSGASQSGIYQTAGLIVATVETDIVSSNYDALLLYGNANSSCRIVADRIIGGSTGEGIEAGSAGFIGIKAREIRAGVDGIGAYWLGSGSFDVEAIRIVGGSTSGGAVVNEASAGVFTVRARQYVAVTTPVESTAADASTVMQVNGGLVICTGANVDAVNVAVGSVFLNGVTARGSGTGDDLKQTGGTLSVVGCDYRRDYITGTITVAPPFDQVLDHAAVAIDASDPGFVTGYLTCYDADGNAEASVTVTLTPVNVGLGATGVAHDGTPREAVSAEDGLVQWTGLQPGLDYRVRRGDRGQSRTFIIPLGTTGSYEFPSIIGGD